ncbi:hypothetical protein [Bacillus sp. FJAT-29937]|uniref:hypothetical protein n=1 Tax=Bacillus sp. FJAT-29937 TaxID=1720553 RepID=UPI0012E34E82|nr:hypothetical protein [Bacillus sp. FJAT-29937]
MAKPFDELYRKFELIGEERGRKEGKEEGRHEGRKEERVEIAKKLFKKGTNVGVIAEITGLTEHEIRELIKQ